MKPFSEAEGRVLWRTFKERAERAEALNAELVAALKALASNDGIEPDYLKEAIALIARAESHSSARSDAALGRVLPNSPPSRGVKVQGESSRSDGKELPSGPNDMAETRAEETPEQCQCDCGGKCH
jgi:hypothetical protein